MEAALRKAATGWVQGQEAIESGSGRGPEHPQKGVHGEVKHALAGKWSKIGAMAVKVPVEPGCLTHYALPACELGWWVWRCAPRDRPIGTNCFAGEMGLIDILAELS